MTCECTVCALIDLQPMQSDLPCSVTKKLLGCDKRWNFHN